MDAWWDRQGEIDMGGYKKSEVEDITGSIPLLLDKCLVDKKIDMTVANLREIYDKAIGFVHDIRAKTKGSGFLWQWYV
jgi:transcriptional regulator of met regulon